MEKLWIALLGFALGLFSKFIYDWYLNRKETASVRRALLLEVLYLHRATMHLQLDKYVDKYKIGHFDESDLNDSFWQPTYPTAIYENMLSRIDKLFGSDLSLQIHYYYLLVQRLNKLAEAEDGPANTSDAVNYLEQAVHAYAMAIGAINALRGVRETEHELRISMQSLIDSFADNSTQLRIAELLHAYGQSGAAQQLGWPNGS